MLKVTVIGHIGANAEVKSANGNEFTVFRVAHTSKWKSEDGVSHEETVWVDVTMQGKPAVLPYLVRGQMVFVEGTANLRVYSSPKDRCMKAGLTVNARAVELLGGKTDDVPALLYNPVDASEYKVSKHYYCQQVGEDPDAPAETVLASRSGEQYSVDANGWVTKMQPE